MPIEGLKIVDDDKFTISALFGSKLKRFWHYDNEAERKRYMMYAREYLEGWCDGRELIDGSGETKEVLERLRDEISRILDTMDGKNA